MSAEEIRWVDDYHRTVYDRLAPLMEADERQWLAAATAPLK